MANKAEKLCYRALPDFIKLPKTATQKKQLSDGWPFFTQQSPQVIRFQNPMYACFLDPQWAHLVLRETEELRGIGSLTRQRCWLTSLTDSSVKVLTPGYFSAFASIRSNRLNPPFCMIFPCWIPQSLIYQGTSEQHARSGGASLLVGQVVKVPSAKIFLIQINVLPHRSFVR